MHHLDHATTDGERATNEDQTTGRDTVPLADLPGSIASRLEVARKDLLDLGLRNPLLNYRLLRARGVEVVDELPSEVFRLLVREGKQMSFLPAPDGQESDALAQPEVDDAGHSAARHVDLRLQTAESPGRLQSRLLATYYAARTSIEEQGVNTLFLALGMLHWYDAKDPKTVRKAPLLLVPVELERSNARARFHIRFNGDEIGPNLSLQEKLKWEFCIAMPPMADVEDLNIGNYFDAVESAIESQPNWSVRRDAVALGFFSFAKLLMFKDLDPATWPEGNRPDDHPLLQSLLGDGFRDPVPSYTEDDNLDRRPEPAQLHPVMDADSSQTLAILDVQGGRNLVIQGPPGTGKSQTITNLIAEGIAAGKTVLFVAEKLAALEVVKRRLDKIGLGDACLELHSHNTQKRALLQEIQRTLDLGRPRNSEGAGDRERLGEARDRLNDYCEAVNAPIGVSGVTVSQALGMVVRLKQQCPPESLVRLEIPDMFSWDAARYRRNESKVEELEARLRPCGVPATHPFRGSARTTFLPTEEDRLRTLLTAAGDATSALQEAGDRLARILQFDPPRNRAAITPMLPAAWQFWRRLFGKDKAARTEVQSAIAAQWDHITALVDFLELDEREQFGDDIPLADRPFDEQQSVLEEWRPQVPSLAALADFRQIADECHAQGLDSVTAVARTWDRAAADLVTTFRYSWFAGLVERAYRERRPLAAFNSESHEHALTQFRKLDGLLPAYNSALLAQSHWQRLPHHNGNGQLAVLKREFEKKTRHLPIRQLMVRAGRPIQAIKPVFMMSPLSIANYLPPNSVDFDLVVFDEASQVRPVDAFGALVRGKQAVVVGDSRQLPPTSFFDSLTRGDDEPDEEESVTSDIESVLGLFSAQLAPQRMLRWHYRSRHESLIAVSNHAFYNDRLVVFPSPDAGRRDVGLRFHHLPESAYDRGRTRTNPIEARAVARAVIEHAHTRPDKSLGVAAFSVAQMQAIQDELEILRREDPDAESFFTEAHPHERFFVKNLETVQGDERDVILISIGYGRTADGYLAMSFGPLNGDGGERRLNVLITRARERCEVFTNLTGDDIVVNGRGRGLYALKMFLHYAQNGHLDVPTEDDLEADSPFEEAVEHELLVRGYTVRRQVGSAGFRIDLAVLDPDRPGRYLLGIECDGATYHSARSARDRDRLRQQVLENLGWRIHRIWSTNWYRQPEAEMRRLEAAIEEAREAGERPLDEAPVGPASTEPRLQRDDTLPIAPEQPAAEPYRMARLEFTLPNNLELHRVDSFVLANLVQRVVDIESPVHRSEVAHRIAQGAGVQRVGNRIDAAVQTAIRRAVARREIQQRDDFLWSAAMTDAPVRDRSALPAASRKLQFVAPEEVDAAIRRVLLDSYGMPPEEVPAAVCRLFGFARVSEDMKDAIEDRLKICLAQGVVALQGDYLTASTTPV